MHADLGLATAPRAGEGEPVRLVRGGPRIVDRTRAPLGQRLPYRRAGGDAPAGTGWDRDVARRGWQLTLPGHSLGDTLLGLAAAVALHAVTDREISYRGPRAALLARCTLPVTAAAGCGDHVLSSGGPAALEVPVVPETPPAWLDLLDGDRVQVHAALPMRYYLTLEQQLGVRLPHAGAPAPTWRSTALAQPGRVVFVQATSRPDRKDYGGRGFAAIAAALAARRPDVTFAVISPREYHLVPAGAGHIEQLGALEATDALEVFAGAELVIGNDTGLTHLAALTERADGSGPHVVGLYGRHSHTKWTTGRPRHHAIGTRFTDLLSMADRCPVRDRLEDTLWGAAAELTALPADGIAAAAGAAAGWWAAP